MEIKGSLGRILRFVFSILNTAIQIHVRDSSVHVSLVGPEAGRSIDDRLESIEAARSALQNALVAVDELARNAEDNKRELADLQRGLEIAAKNKENAVGELEDIKKLAKLETKLVRQTLGLPNTRDLWVQRGVGFLFGVVGSLIASIIFEFFSNL